MKEIPLRILLVYPELPDTLWSFKHAFKFIRKKAGCVTWFSLSPNVLKE
jgi:hypothetical protein